MVTRDGKMGDDEYLRFAEQRASRPAERGKRSTTMGEVAIARGLMAVARAIEMLAKPPIQLVMSEDQVTTVPPVRPTPPPPRVDARMCPRFVMFDGHRVSCTRHRTVHDHGTDTLTGAWIHEGILLGRKIEWHSPSRFS